jgi:hypothetical protein
MLVFPQYCYFLNLKSVSPVATGDRGISSSADDDQGYAPWMGATF